MALRFAWAYYLASLDLVHTRWLCLIHRLEVRLSLREQLRVVGVKAPDSRVGHFIVKILRRVVLGGVQIGAEWVLLIFILVAQ
jgi:hypothetical protein